MIYKNIVYATFCTACHQNTLKAITCFAAKIILLLTLVVLTAGYLRFFQNNTEISFVVPPQSTIYSKIEIPSNGSVELKYVVNKTTSTGMVYLSESIANPNAALNDASFEVNVVRNIAS